MDLEVETRTGGTAWVPEAEIAALAAALDGTVLTAGDPCYDDVRAVWNGDVDRRPALIARAASTADVVAAVDLRLRHDLLVSVRGGGHSLAGHAVCDGGLMLDLAPMDTVDVDAERRVARVGAGSAGATSTGRRRRWDWRPPAGRCPGRAWPASRSVVGSAT